MRSEENQWKLALDWGHYLSGRVQRICEFFDAALTLLRHDTPTYTHTTNTPSKPQTPRKGKKKKEGKKRGNPPIRMFWDFSAAD